MSKFINFLKILPGVLLRIGHLIKHLFCNVDECEVDVYEN